MKKHDAGILVFAVLLLVGCGTTSTTEYPSNKASIPQIPSDPAHAGAPPRTVATTSDSNDAAGLGQIVYSGRDVIDCGRTRRTGSRIPRDVCNPTSFNGLFPSGGINMGTAKESQPGYGNR